MPRRILFETLDWLPGYRFGLDGSVWSRWKQQGKHKGYAVGGNWHKLAELKGEHGYSCVRLKWGNKIIHLRIHRLILESFVGTRPKGLVCRHLNGNPADNRLCNLKWGTRQENIGDTMRHGRVPKGERHHKAKMTPEKVRQVFLLRWQGMKFKDIGIRFGLTDGGIRDIYNRRNWQHVSMPARPRKLLRN